MEEQKPEDVKKRRFEALLELQDGIGRQINDQLAGKSVEILVEGLSKTVSTWRQGGHEQTK